MTLTPLVPSDPLPRAGEGEDVGALLAAPSGSLLPSEERTGEGEGPGMRVYNVNDTHRNFFAACVSYLITTADLRS